MQLHVPVMVDEVLHYLAIAPSGRLIDCTCGLAGHSLALVERLGPDGRLICRDADPESVEIARQRLAPYNGRVRFEVGKFSDLAVDEPVDGLLADLGISMHQLRTPERGFSFDSPYPADMRLNRSEGLSAAEWINTSSESEIAKIIEEFGEERSGKARKIARAISRSRPVTTAKRLADIVAQAAPWEGRLHPATRTFQAIRMVTTGEMDEVAALVKRIPMVLAPGGRAVIITFESLTDRIVKRGFQELARGGAAEILTKHVIRPRADEVRRNPASRSAKLRALRMAAHQRGERER
jgi:16S rRNA (cytosine1402-N4)-methyltransferase